MRLLLINPNMTQSMTDTMANIAQRTVGANVEIVAITAERGFPYIASRAEAQIAGGIVLDMIAEHGADFDAVIVAAFGDPGVAAARELFDIPIVGMAEAAVMSAALLAKTFAVVTFSSVMHRWYTDCVNATGLSARFCGVLTPEAHSVDVSAVRHELRKEMIQLATKAVQEDSADVIIMGGAPLAGLAPDIALEVPAIVIDPIAAAAAQAVALAQITDKGAFANRASKPVAKSSVGLTPPLAAAIGKENV
ncbi:MULTISPECIES: aspartate/glutamate racemase family protein [Falsihalocynthiibacter]|uniref:aspartate/glutamate racemase family protein n=1 Tax=Falsihalocynthiibacter TaxID=2854182 RepID=UPI003001697C